LANGISVSWNCLTVLPEEFDGLPSHAEVSVKELDKRTKGFSAEYGDLGAEAEALPQEELRRPVESVIESHIDPNRWKKSKRSEAGDIRRLKAMFAR
jgi:hypothetical protein